eukprot:symbB.v1.2.003421.t2/scaffold183.1/size281544/5
MPTAVSVKGRVGLALDFDLTKTPAPAYLDTRRNLSRDYRAGIKDYNNMLINQVRLTNDLDPRRWEGNGFAGHVEGLGWVEILDGQKWWEFVWLPRLQSESQGRRPTPSSFRRVLAKLEWPEAILLLFALLREQRMTLIAEDYTLGIAKMTKSQMWQSALSLFHSMPVANVKANVFSYNTSISSCEKGMQWQQALKLFAVMLMRDLQADVVSYNTVLTSCQKGMQLKLALDLFAVMSEVSIQPSVVSYNAIITCMQWQGALNFFEAFSNLNVNIQPDIVSYSSTISACEKAAQWQRALKLFLTMPSSIVQHSVISYNAAISSCEKGGQWEQALNLFFDMDALSIERDVVSCNAAISSCEKSRTQWQLALSLFVAMPNWTIQPSVISYNAVISACELQWQQALSLFEAMLRSTIKPSISSYNAVISSCEKGIQWHHALALFAAMPSAKIQPSVITLNAVMTACEKSTRWQQALDLFHCVQRKIHVDVDSCSSAINCCEQGMQWQLVQYVPYIGTDLLRPGEKMERDMQISTMPRENGKPLNVSQMTRSAGMLGFTRAPEEKERQAHATAIQATQNLREVASTLQRQEDGFNYYGNQAELNQQRQERITDVAQAMQGLRAAGLASINPRMGTIGTFTGLTGLRGEGGNHHWRQSTPWAYGGDWSSEAASHN